MFSQPSSCALAHPPGAQKRLFHRWSLPYARCFLGDSVSAGRGLQPFPALTSLHRPGEQQRIAQNLCEVQNHLFRFFFFALYNVTFTVFRVVPSRLAISDWPQPTESSTRIISD